MPKRNFYDLYLVPNIDKVKSFLQLARYLGYSGVGIQLNNYSFDILKHVIDLSKRIGIKVLFRINEPRYIEELAALSNRIVTSMIVKSEKEFREGIKLRNIRILSFNSLDFARLMTKENLNIIKQYPEKFIEVTIADLINAQRKERAFIISLLHKKIKLINSKSLRLIISSGAKSLNELSSPRCVRSFLRILGVKENRILESMSDNPKIVFKLPRRIIISSD